MSDMTEEEAQRIVAFGTDAAIEKAIADAGDYGSCEHDFGERSVLAALARALLVQVIRWRRLDAEVLSGALRAERDALRVELTERRDEIVALQRRRDQLYGDCERMRPVFEAAKRWRTIAPWMPAVGYSPTRDLALAVDDALAKEPR